MYLSCTNSLSIKQGILTIGWLMFLAGRLQVLFHSFNLKRYPLLHIACQTSSMSSWNGLRIETFLSSYMQKHSENCVNT